MRRWSNQLEAQRRKYKEREISLESYRANGTSETEFEFMRGQQIENPYARQPDEEDDDADDSGSFVAGGGQSWSGHHYHNRGEYSQSRNASQTSLRSRSTTGESSALPPAAALAHSRAMPPRLPPGAIAHPGHGPLSLRTAPLASPGDRDVPESYFSPGGDSPLSSSRTSSSSNMYPFPRQPYTNGYYEDNASHARFTAPATARPMLGRETSAPPVVDGYGPAPPRTSAVPRTMHSSTQIAPPRNRSASSPDINQNVRGIKRVGPQPPVPDVPASYQGPYPPPPHVVARSQTGSPALSNGVPSRGNGSTSPNSQRERGYSMRREESNSSANYPYEGRAAAAATSTFPLPPASRGATPVPRQQAFTPAAQSFSTGLPAPTQLKVKVHCPAAGQVLTLVVPLNITYQSLKDRIDAKLQRSTNLTLGSTSPDMSAENVVKLKYLDEDDYVTIQTDEDVQEAFESWREQTQGGDPVPGMGEVELFCQR